MCGVDEPMRVRVEILGTDDVADAVGGIVVEQQPAQHRLLGLDRVRRQLQRIDLRIVGHAEAGERANAMHFER